MRPFLIVCLAALAAVPAQAEVKNSRIIQKRGRVIVVRGGERLKALNGMRLEAGDWVVTKARAFALLRLAGGASLKLKAKSDLRIPAAGKDGLFRSVFLRAGGVFTKIRKAKGMRFQLETKGAVAAVRGTEFFTAYGRKSKGGRDLWLCVNEGAVEVSATGSKSKVLVKEGEGIIVTPSKPIEAPKEYEWTKDLNWNMDPGKGELKDDSSLNSAYKDSLLEHDYD